MLLSVLYHHICLSPSSGKADFFLCCFNVVGKEPESHNPALACVITSENQQPYVLVLSQIHYKIVQVHKTLCALGVCNCKWVVSSHPTALRSCSTQWKPLTLFLGSCCFSAAWRSQHQNLCQSDISVAAPINWNKNNHLKLTAVMEWKVSIEGTAQLFLANSKIMGRMVLWKIFHPICIVIGMIRMLTKSSHHGI